MTAARRGKQRDPRAALVRAVGRYEMYGTIGSGGMATVHLGRLYGAGGFSRSVAIKKLHAQFARSEEFVAMFTYEARLASRIQHANVAATLDVIAKDDELFIVMELIEGETLARLCKEADAPLPASIACAIAADVLRGLHAAHEARSEQGDPLNIVHRDVSPQNIIIGTDGNARVLDFGIAKAAGATHITEDGMVKGKRAYMAPEQIYGEPLDRRSDVYAMGVVLWEMLTGRMLFGGEGATVTRVLERPVEPPGILVGALPAGLDKVVMRALDRDIAARFDTADAMLQALSSAAVAATPDRVSAWLHDQASERLADLRQLVRQVETRGRASIPPGADEARPPSQQRWPLLVAAAMATGVALVVWRQFGLAANTPAPPALVADPDTSATLSNASARVSPGSSISVSANATAPTRASAAAAMNAPGDTAGPAAADISSNAVVPSSRVQPPRKTTAPPATPHPGTPATSSTVLAPVDCDPPYVLDAAGRRKYKRACF